MALPEANCGFEHWFECVDEEEHVRVEVQAVGVSSFLTSRFSFRTNHLRRRQGL